MTARRSLADIRIEAARGLIRIAERRALTRDEWAIARVSWADAFSAVHAALDAGLVLHGRDVDERCDLTAGRERRAIGPDMWITWSYYEGGRQEREEYTSASDLARSLIGNAIVPGILGKVGAWSSAVAAIDKAGITPAFGECKGYRARRTCDHSRTEVQRDRAADEKAADFWTGLEARSDS